ncbi:MAG: rhodanese-like domain-containing protein [Tenuifilaceae bacterium]|jgi:thiosulfate/3-mercaptopyruvate sulfurtransferase|nr:rhodanese-like domain-containing protein [Tenuifilaceae bacterium]
MRTIVSIIALFVLTISAVAQDMISAADAKKAANSAIIVSTRPAEDYAKVHIKNAIHVSVDDLATTEDPKGILKSPEELAKILGGKGLDPAKKIIIYDTGSNKSAGRLYWILKYLGFSDVKVLDGHINAWRAARAPVTNAATAVKAVSFTPKVNEKIFADIKYVKSKLGSAVLVDVRDDNEIAGGMIKGAKHFKYDMVINENGTLKSKEELAKMFNEAGITKDKEVILYCATSVRAGIVFLALTSVLEYPNVKVYDGAYNEWKLN